MYIRIYLSGTCPHCTAFKKDFLDNGNKKHGVLRDSGGNDIQYKVVEVENAKKGDIPLSVQGYPTCVLFDDDGREIGQIAGKPRSWEDLVSDISEYSSPSSSPSKSDSDLVR